MALRDAFCNLTERPTLKTFYIKTLEGPNDISLILKTARTLAGNPHEKPLEKELPGDGEYVVLHNVTITTQDEYGMVIVIKFQINKTAWEYKYEAFHWESQEIFKPQWWNFKEINASEYEKKFKELTGRIIRSNKPLSNEIIVYDYFDSFSYCKISPFSITHPRLAVAARIEYEDDITFKKISFLTNKTLLGLTTNGQVYCIALDHNAGDFRLYNDTMNDNYDIENNITLHKQTFKCKDSQEEASIDEMAVDPCYPFHVILYTNGKIKYWNLKTGKIQTVFDEKIPQPKHLRFYNNTIYFYNDAYGATTVTMYTITPGIISSIYDYYNLNISSPDKTTNHNNQKQKTLVLAAAGMGGLVAGHLLAKRYNLFDSKLYYPIVVGAGLLGAYATNSNLLQKLANSSYVKGALGGAAGYKLGWYLTNKLGLQNSKLKYPLILGCGYLGASYCSRVSKKDSWINYYYNL